MNITAPGVTPEDERRHQARIWYIQRCSASKKKLPPTLEKQWRRWTQDPANLTAYRNFSHLHSMLLTVPPPSLPCAAELHADSPDLRLDTHPDSKTVPSRNMTPSSWRPSQVQVRTACVIVAIIVLTWATPRISGLPDITLAQTQIYTTPPGVPVIDVKIVAGSPLERVLIDVGDKAGLHLVLATASLAGHTTPPLQGKFPFTVALTRLLKGSGLTYKIEGTYFYVYPISPPQNSRIRPKRTPALPQRP